MYKFKMKAEKLNRLLNDGWSLLEIACLYQGIKSLADNEKKLLAEDGSICDKN